MHVNVLTVLIQIHHLYYCYTLQFITRPYPCLFYIRCIKSEFRTWTRPIIMTQAQKSRMPRVFSGKAAIRENYRKWTMQSSEFLRTKCGWKSNAVLGVTLYVVNHTSSYYNVSISQCQDPFSLKFHSLCTGGKWSTSYKPEIGTKEENVCWSWKVFQKKKKERN